MVGIGWAAAGRRRSGGAGGAAPNLAPVSGFGYSLFDWEPHGGRARQRVMMGHMAMQRLIPVAALFALAACGQGADSGDGAGDAAQAECTESSNASCGDGGTQSGEATVPADEIVYQGALTVLQGIERDSAELCGMVAESYPPQCGGLPVTGWDWSSVEHEEAEGVRWGSYIVTGTFDGKSLVLTEDPVATADVDMEDYPNLQYEEPEIGDPAEELSAEELQVMADELAEEFPRYVYGGWADEQNGVALVDTLLVTPELEAYVAEHFPEDTVVFSSMLKPVE